MTFVYNVKTEKTWSRTFSNENDAREAIERGHDHDTSHLIISSYGGERKSVDLSYELALLLVDDMNSFEILLELKFDEKINTEIPKKSISELCKYGLITTFPIKLTELGDLVITRLLVKSGIGDLRY
jgi:hypothetical protein